MSGARMGRRAMALLLALVGLLSGPAQSQQLRTPTERGTAALLEGRCEAAMELLNQALKDGEPDAYFVVGLMYVKGICVKAAPARAPEYLEPAARAASADAARTLVLMHGYGIGVSRSFAQAGRWALAWIDIEKLRSGKSLMEDRPRLVSADSAELLGVLSSVAAAVQDRIDYPRPSAVRLTAAQVSLNLKLRLDGQGVAYQLTDVVVAPEDDIRSTIARRSPQPYIEHMRQVIDAAIGELGEYPRPQEPFELLIPYRFILR